MSMKPHEIRELINDIRFEIECTFDFPVDHGRLRTVIHKAVTEYFEKKDKDDAN